MGGGKNVFKSMAVNVSLRWNAQNKRKREEMRYVIKMLNKTFPNSHTHSHFLHIRNLEYISAWALKSSHVHPEKSERKKEREEGGREGGGEKKKAGEMKEENWG